MPRASEWITFTEWRKTYGNSGPSIATLAPNHTGYSSAGNIIHLSVFGRPVIVLDSANAALDLLERRSSIYADRPRMPMGGELVGWEHTVARDAASCTGGNRPGRSWRVSWLAGKCMHKVFGQGVGYSRAALGAYSTVSLSSLRWRTLVSFTSERRSAFR